MGADIRASARRRSSIARRRARRAARRSTTARCPDRIQAATYLAAVAVAGGELDAARRPARAHGEAAAPASPTWASSSRSATASLRVVADERLRSIDVPTLPYPGIATDYKPLIITMLQRRRRRRHRHREPLPRTVPLRRGAAAPRRRHPHQRPPRRGARRAPPVAARRCGPTTSAPARRWSWPGWPPRARPRSRGVAPHRPRLRRPRRPPGRRRRRHRTGLTRRPAQSAWSACSPLPGTGSAPGRVLGGGRCGAAHPLLRQPQQTADERHRRRDQQHLVPAALVGEDADRDHGADVVDRHGIVGRRLVEWRIDTSSRSNATRRMRAAGRETIEVIRPALQADGGDIVLHDVDEATGVVTVELVGACGRCPASTQTLKAGIERIMRDRVDGVTEVIDVDVTSAEATVADGAPRRRGPAASSCSPPPVPAIAPPAPACCRWSSAAATTPATVGPAGRARSPATAYTVGHHRRARRRQEHADERADRPPARRWTTEVAVLAIDPSSPFTGGAILGDRVRMQDHATDAGVFIRSMATRGHLGGLALAAPEAVRLLDAVGHRLGAASRRSASARSRSRWPARPTPRSSSSTRAGATACRPTRPG